MRRLLNIIFLASFLIPLFSSIVSFAQPTGPQSGIWIEPAKVKPGVELKLNAFIYNSTDRSVTVTVLFMEEKGPEIGTVNIDIPSQTAKVVTVPWKMPAIPTTVSAAVTKASDANKTSVTDLIGTLGKITVGALTAQELIPSGLVSTFKNWFGGAFSTIEPWRQKQSEHFITMRNKARKDAGLATLREIGEQLGPDTPATPNENKDDIEDLTRAPSVPVGSYFVLIYATALATLFSSLAIFYITLVLLSILVLRYALSLFFRLFR